MAEKLDISSRNGIAKDACSSLIERVVSLIRVMTVACANAFKSWNDDRLMNAALEPLKDHMLRDIGLERLEVNQTVVDPDNYSSQLRIYVERDAAGDSLAGFPIARSGK